MLDTMNDLSRLDRSELTNPTALHLDRTTVVPVFLPDCRMALSIESNYVSESPCYLLSSHEPTQLESSAVLASPITRSSQLFPCNGPLSSSPLRESSHSIQTTESKPHSLTAHMSLLHGIDQSGFHLLNHAKNESDSAVESPIKHPNEHPQPKGQNDSEVHSHRGSKENALQWGSGEPVHKIFSPVPSTLWSPVSCPSPSLRPLGQVHVRTHRTTDRDVAFADTTAHCNFHSTDANMVSISALSRNPIPEIHPHLSPNLPRKEGANGTHCTQYTHPTSSTVEAITMRLQTLSSPPETHDELHVFTGFSNSGPAGTEEPPSLEVSSETQRAMESSDSTPPSTGNGSQRNPGSKQTGQFSSVGENPGYESEKFHPSSPTTKWVPHLCNNNMDKDGLMKHGRPFEHIIKASESYQIDAAESSDLCPSSPQTPNAYNECGQPDKAERAASLTGSEPHSSAEDSDEGMSMARFEQMTNSVQPDKAGLFFCHLCEFTGCSRQEFQDHLRSHYDYKCMKCDYTSRTEGRLKRHLKDFHSEIPPENFSGKAIKPIRSKLQRCKQCDFMTETKDEFWRHLRVHIKEDKRLECNLCCFVTEYKHHLEYHMRNHMGSKPYKCPKCNYECVNKSMLNSHMKSHSNVYPYRCANCHYATKYCHSLKLHLAKNGHKPAVVLNADGSLPSYDNTSELMSLRRGPNIRQISARGQSNSSPDSMNDQKLAGHPDIQNTLSNSATGMITFGENLAVRHFGNSGTVQSNDGGANHVISPDPLLFSPCLSFPFPFTNATVPHFPALTFSNPLLGPSGLFPSLINQSKLVHPLSEPSGLLPHPALSANLLPLDKHTISNVSVSSLPNLNGPPFPYPDPSVMAAILAAMQHNSTNHGVSLAPVLTQSIIPTHVTAPSSRSTQYLCQTTLSPLKLGVVTQVTSPTTPQPPLQVPLSRNSERGFTQPTSEVVQKQDPNTRLNLVEKDSPTELTMKEQRSPVKSENTDAEYALDLSSKIHTQWISQSEYARPSTSPQFRDSRTAVRPNGSRKRLRRFRSAHRIRNGVGKQFSTACSASTSSDSTDQEDRTHFDYECRFCEIRFRHRALYDIHMGFHSHADPYLCNRCGHHSRDPVDFFIHLGQMAHYS
ncbi:hypothetical protein PHET_04351 [Paragonimus heterotremus]|uniref:C2H2-type domain-containing protein n=1 Tax=Paragonimus heterotremus TaxID=100268 RepID=A0A8J4TIS4_9TREM|nr:hypothetical protein PHET_04351 [Paragonimus heterotremus]